MKGDKYFRKYIPGLILTADVSRLDLNMNAITSLKLDRQRKMVNIVPIDIAWLASEVQVRRKPAPGVVDIVCFVTRAYILGVNGFGILDVGQDIHTIVGRRWNGKDRVMTGSRGYMMFPTSR